MIEPGRSIALALDDRREKAIEKLSHHFASDRLDATEFEMRLDRLYKAQTLEELDAVHADLPDVAPDVQAVQTTRPGENVRQWQLLAALMGGTDRAGNWRPARNILAWATMGGICLDFREAVFAPGITELYVIALMGGVEIIVPPGLRVETDGMGVMGGFEGIDHAPRDAGDETPTLRIRGIAIMGGVEVAVRYPGESAREARIRAKETRKRLKEKRKELRGG